MIFLYKNIKIYTLACLLIIMSFETAWCAAGGRDKVKLAPMTALTWDCISRAADYHEVPVAALLGILATEGGQLGEALSNTNRTWDLGPFQINTCHVDKLALFGVDPFILTTDSCLNASAAAWLLREQINRSKDIWEAVGAYHSRTPRHHDAYIKRVQSNLSLLYERTDRIERLIEFANGQRRGWK